MARLTKDARRTQLLEVAHAIVERDGTDALTLARLAEEAGVSKPIAYDHFGTRQGVLAALFRTFDALQIEAMRAAMATGGATVDDAVATVAAGYLDCVIGPEYEEVSAALLAYEDTKDALKESRAAFLDVFADALGPFAQLDDAVLAGLVGAGDALAREMQDGTLGRDAAVDAFTAILRATLGARARARTAGARTGTRGPRRAR